MKNMNIELKTCPNCKKRIGIQDTECPFCKYIDDPKYKKYNEKLKKKKQTKKTKKNDIYKPILLIPTLAYLTYLIFDTSALFLIISLIILNILCLFTKKTFLLYISLIEMLVLIFNLITSIYEMLLANNFKELSIQITIFILGITFIIIPKFIYLAKTKKKKQNKKDKVKF